MRVLFEPGDFVWTNFPFEAEPRRPGPTRHAGLVLGTFTPKVASNLVPGLAPSQGIVIAVYTSSQTGKFEKTLPVGVISVPSDRARKTGNRTAFFIDVRRRAYMPLTRDFFPELDRPDFGIVGRADKGLFSEVRRQFILVNERHSELIVNLGPYKPS